MTYFYISRCPYFKVSLFNSVLISGCPYFRGVLNSTYFRHVLISGCPYFRVSLFQGVLISGCHYFRVSLFQGVLISDVSLFQECPYFKGVLISSVYPYKMLYITLILKNIGSLYIDIYTHFVLFEGKAVLSRLGLYIRSLFWRKQVKR